MKTLLILLFISGSLLADANTDWVDEQVAAIKPPRKGVSADRIKQIKDPFIITYKENAGKKHLVKNKKSGSSLHKKSMRGLRLHAIMNDSALINGRWLRPDEKIRGYTIEKISTRSVLLRHGKEKVTLTLSKADKKIKIQIK